MPKKAALRYLRSVAGDARFYARDGCVLANLFDLYAFLKECGDDTFRHHVDGSRNDFAEWVRGSVMDGELAGLLDRCLLRQPMMHRLLMRINSLVSATHREPAGREKARMLLEEAAAPEELFETADGRRLRSLWELYGFLEDAGSEVFGQHVGEGRNDIADWVDDVVCDDKLAGRIRGVRDQEMMRALVGLRVGSLESIRPERLPDAGYCARVKRSMA